MPATINDAFDCAEAVGHNGKLILSTLGGLQALIASATAAGELPTLVGPQLHDRVTDLAHAIAIEFVGPAEAPPTSSDVAPASDTPAAEAPPTPKRRRSGE